MKADVCVNLTCIYVVVWVFLNVLFNMLYVCMSVHGYVSEST